jgi:hypothetical protein
MMLTGIPRLARTPWNKGRIIGQKRPLKRKDVWAIRVRLQREVPEPDVHVPPRNRRNRRKLPPLTAPARWGRLNKVAGLTLLSETSDGQ